MKIDDDLKPHIIQAIDSLMENQSKPDCGINPDDAEVKNLLSQNKGGFAKERFLSKDSKVSVRVKWNKTDLYFGCSIAFLKKLKNETWLCEARFDDAHECRHFDAYFSFGKGKLFDGRFVEAKAQCPILIQIIKALPQEKANEWKLKLFSEIVVGNQRKKQHFENPSSVQFK